MKRLPTLLAPTVIAALMLAACGGKDPAELVGSAKDLLERGDHRTAVIELKSALQENPEHAEARYMLGKALLAAGDPNGASIELNKALESHYEPDEVVPELARALLLKGDYQALLQQFEQTTLTNPLAEADLRYTIARANGGLGRREPARAAIEATLKAVPDYGPANVFKARLQADTGDIDGALAALDRQLKRTPQDAEGWQVKGDLLLLGKRDPNGALEAYRQAVAVKPTHIPGHAGALTILLGRQDAAAARTQLAEMEAVLPRHPQTLYYAGSVALLEKNLDNALEIVQQLLRVNPNNPRVLQLAGGVAYERQAFIQAENHLSKALQLDPSLDVARRLLAATHLQRSEPAKALAVLEPLLERPNPTAALFTLKAQAHLQAGDLPAAESALAQAAKLNPDDVRSRTALVVSRVLKGEDSGALAELRSLAANDDRAIADLPLIATLIRKGDFKAAFVAIDALEKKQPDKPIAANLRARVLMQQGDRKAAEAAYRRALEIQPSFFPAAAALAQIAMLDKRLDDAEAIIDSVLKVAPDNTQALLASAALKARGGAPREKIVALFNHAISQAPSDPAPRLALVNYLMSHREFKNALEVSQNAVAALPDNPSMLDALGRAQAASGDANQALASFGKLAQLVPNSPAPHLRAADVHWGARNPDAAIQALKRALSVDPNSLAAQRSLVDAYLATQKYDEARTVARQIRKQRPNQDFGYLIEGGIEASQERWKRAIEIYREGLKAAQSSTELATRLHVALNGDKQDDAAKAHVADWLRKHPDDVGFHYYLGDLALGRNDRPQAEKHYRDVLRVQPENALALNNVAWLMASAKKPGAVEMAERAVALLPDRPVILDTLALALASENRMDRAIEVMYQAVRLEDKNPQLRFNYAKLLIQSGKRAEARAELEWIAKLGPKYPRHGEVTEMLKKL